MNKICASDSLTFFNELFEINLEIAALIFFSFCILSIVALDFGFEDERYGTKHYVQYAKKSASVSYFNFHLLSLETKCF